jgi:hypothetical protein
MILKKRVVNRNVNFSSGNSAELLLYLSSVQIKDFDSFFKPPRSYALSRGSHPLLNLLFFPIFNGFAVRTRQAIVPTVNATFGSREGERWL